MLEGHSCGITQINNHGSGNGNNSDIAGGGDNGSSSGSGFFYEGLWKDLLLGVRKGTHFRGL